MKKKLYRYKVVFSYVEEVNAENADEAIGEAQDIVFGRFETMADQFAVKAEKLWKIKATNICDICGKEMDGFGCCGCTNKDTG